METVIQERRTFSVLDVDVDALTPSRAIAEIRRMAFSARRGYLVFCTASTVLSARDDPEVARALQEAALVTPDGMPLVWLGRRQGFQVERVYGPDFMLDLFAATGSELTHFFYGGEHGVAEQTAVRLKERFPKLRVVGWASPAEGLDPHNPPEADLASIKTSGADVVWVGLGHPKQELFMWANRERIEASVMAGVGAAFDFHAGKKGEAPQWMKRSGLQWLHRLASEPRRLWRRYLIGNARFVVLLILDALRARHARY